MDAQSLRGVNFPGLRDVDVNPPPQWGASRSYLEIFYFNEHMEVSPGSQKS